MVEKEVRTLTCPICDYSVDKCQCIYAGSGHPDRTKRFKAAVENLHLLSIAQVMHIRRLESYWDISYSDEELQKEKDKLRR